MLKYYFKMLFVLKHGPKGPKIFFNMARGRKKLPTPDLDQGFLTEVPLVSVLALQ